MTCFSNKIQKKKSKTFQIQQIKVKYRKRNVRHKRERIKTIERKTHAKDSW